MHTMVIQSLCMPEINRAARLPAWRQIHADLRRDIASGRYGPDDRLPSATELSAAYGVARLTALKALRQLVAEGLAEMESGMGFYVTGTGIKPR